VERTAACENGIPSLNFLNMSSYLKTWHGRLLLLTVWLSDTGYKEAINPYKRINFPIIQHLYPLTTLLLVKKPGYSRLLLSRMNRADSAG